MGSFEDRRTAGMVFNIQKYSVHDGPGIRTIVFLKGCPLSCAWCSNPESQSLLPQLAHNQGRCIGLHKCTRCLEACARGAITPTAEQTLGIDRALCQKCTTFDCAGACPSQGLIVYGEPMKVEDILNKVEQDAIFYKRSGGGMTLSGGEPLFQSEFALALLREAKKRRIKSAIETCGMVPWETLSTAAGLLNSVLFDIKHMDTARHKEATSVGNETILHNLKRLMEDFPKLPVLVRTPVIPSFNDTDEQAEQIGRFLAGYDNVTYEALAYHRLGTQKYAFLGREYLMGEESLPKETAERFQRIVDEVRAQ